MSKDLDITEIFREFHSKPELSNEEFETTKKIKELLEEANIKVLDLGLKTGLVAEIGKEGPIVALRCDIDALPIDEDTNLSYKSKIKGKMHACGHDFHIATILGAAYLLKKVEDNLYGKVRLVFQPAEETGHGAEKIIETKVLEDVDVIFGLHNDCNLPVGTIGTNVGALTAAVDRFEINIEGVGAHAADPERAIDPIVIASQTVTALQTIISRNLNPYDKAVVSVTRIESGNTWNVIPMIAVLEGTVRTFKSETREFIRERIKNISEGIAKSFGGNSSLEWYPGPPATNNNEKWTGFSINIARDLGYEVRKLVPGFGGEDFSYYQEKIQGVFINIGTGVSYPHHHPKFEVSESALNPAAKYFAEIAIRALKTATKQTK